MNEVERGKREVFEALVVEHHVRVRAFVRSLGVDPDWVDDIAQEAFLTAYREWDSYDEGRDFGRWLRGIAANLVRNEIRKDARRQRILQGELTEVLLGRQAESGRAPEPVTIAAIRECLHELAPRSRTIVQARYRDGENAPRIAERLGMSAMNVRQILVRARQQIKQCVELRMGKGALI